LLLFIHNETSKRKTDSTPAARY